MKLIIGNRNYSSWSLRPWILLRTKQIEFEEQRISLYVDGSDAELARYSDSGLVPVLEDGDLSVWDSLAICEYLAEKYPDKGFWPGEPAQRAFARSVSAEMHSGFLALRECLPMNCRRRVSINHFSSELRSDINRVREIWQQCLGASDDENGFLFGDFSIVDAMYAPVVVRFENYGVEVSDNEKAYMRRILELDGMVEWFARAVEEKEVAEASEL